MPYQIDTNMLKPGDFVAIHGTVAFSRITKKIDGDELIQDQQRRAMRGWSPIEKPYTSITINNAQVLVKDPSQPTLFEQYVSERLYQSTSANAQGYSYTATSKGRDLPWVALQRENSSIYDQIRPEGELATGVEVTIVLRAFKAPQHNGVALDGVICTNGIRYFSVNSPDSAISSLFGGTLNPLPANAVTEEPAENAEVPTPSYDEPVATPFSAQPAQPAQQPAQVATMPANMPVPQQTTPQQPMQPQGINPAATYGMPGNQGGIVTGRNY